MLRIMKINLNIFKDYDIRGIYPEEINEETAFLLGKLFCFFLDQKQIFGPILVAEDARLSSPALKQEFIRAVLSQGRDVIDIGLSTTPLFHFSFIQSKAAGGAIITASHNPKEYNGLKLLSYPNQYLYAEYGLPELKKIISENIDVPAKKIAGKMTTADYSGDYLDFTVSFIPKNLLGQRKIKIISDASNGNAGFLLRRYFKKLGIANTELFYEPDGNFPNHPPNPLLPESWTALQNKIREEKPDFGVIVDADADRIFFFDETGEMIQSDIIYAFLLDYYSKVGEEILYEIRSSKIIEEIAAKKGVIPKRIRNGRTFVVAEMKKNNARLMVETSGHYFFKELFYSDSSLLALSYVLAAYLAQNQKFSELIRSYQKYFWKELNFKINDADALIQKLKITSNDGKQIFIDGLSVEYPDWRFNIRKSKTEPLIRLALEANGKELLNQKEKEILEIIKPFLY